MTERCCGDGWIGDGGRAVERAATIAAALGAAVAVASVVQRLDAVVRLGELGAARLAQRHDLDRDDADAALTQAAAVAAARGVLSYTNDVAVPSQ